MPNCSLECTHFPSISIVWDGLVTTSSTTLCGMNLLNLCKSDKWEIISCFHLHLKLLVRWNILYILLASCVFCEWPIYILCLYSPIGLLSFPYYFIKDVFFFNLEKERLVIHLAGIILLFRPLILFMEFSLLIST